MVDFRRWILALAIVALFAGLASAQVNIGPVGTTGAQLTCAATVAVPPALRQEGVTELIGDIVLTCSGGQQPVAGQALPTANIVVSLPTGVTSRILNNNQTPAISEAVLMIDEPGSGLPPVVAGSGPGALQAICGTPLVGAGAGGCVQYPIQIAGPGGVAITVQSSSPTTLTQPANMFQGVWNSAAPNQIQFLGIPVMPPVTSGFARVYRMTNIRANVAGYGGTGLAGTVPLNASVSISSSTSVLVNNPTLTTGFIQQSLNVGLRNANNNGGINGTTGTGFLQCQGQGLPPVSIATLQFSENFATAWKTRVSPNSNPGGSGQAGPGSAFQNVPGVIYNSESGFIPGNSFGCATAGNCSQPPVVGPAGGGGTTGLNSSIGFADYGTRLKVTLKGVPSGVSVYVSTTNLSNANTNPPTPTTATVPFAALVVNETALDTSTAAPPFGANNLISGIPAVTQTTTTSAGVPVAQVSLDSNGNGTAVWEVVQTNPNALETLNFGIYLSYGVSSGINSPPIPAGQNTVTSQVYMSYAPALPDGASSTAQANWGNPSVTSSIPRFVDLRLGTSGYPFNLFSITICQTVLLYPYVINTNGFDTGIAVANTTSDPFGTRNQVGTCGMNFYGSSAPTTQPVLMPGTGASGNNVLTGTVSVQLASAAAPGFAGYMIMTCNFSLAHGFAFISDIGARNLAMGYLALVVPTITGNRNGVTVESLAH